MDNMDYLNDFLLAQREMRNVEKNAINEFGGYNYSTIDGIINAIKGPLNDNGFIISQILQVEDGKQYLVTEFVHVSGKAITSKMLLDLGDLDPKKNRAQCMGALITYYRKYSLICLAGICSGKDDDDAEILADRFISSSDVKLIETRIGQYTQLLSDVLKLNGVRDLKKIASDKLEDTIAFIDKKLKAIGDAEKVPLIKPEQKEELLLILNLDKKGDLYNRILRKFDVKDLKDIPEFRFQVLKDWLNDLLAKREAKKDAK
jgi:hypothetical protein